MKVQVKRAFKCYFCRQKSNKKPGRFCMKFFSISNTSVSKSIPPIFCCPLFSENYLNPQVKINKMVNNHTVDYHPSPLQLFSRIHLTYFYGLLTGLSEFFPKPVYSTMVPEKFQIYSVKITGKYICESKN